MYMKKLLVIISLVFVGMSANAQWYLGGSFNLGSNSTKDSDGEKQTTTFNFGIQPEVGYYISERCDIGATLGVGFDATKNHLTDAKTKTNNWRISPFIRYALVRLGNFELIERTNVFIGGDKDASETKTFNVGAGVTPILAYNVNDHLTLQTELNFVSVGITYSKVKDGGSSTNANIGFNSNNVAILGGITIGFLYKF